MSIATQIINNNCLPFPKILQLEITDRCPFNCPQCYRLSLADNVKMRKEFCEALLRDLSIFLGIF